MATDPAGGHTAPDGVAGVTGPTYARRSARVLLLERRGRVLLLRYENGEWFTPGGGVDEGEDPRQAAVRELREEIGLKVDPADLGPLVAVTSGYAALGWVEGVLRDDYFLHRVDAHTVDTSGLAPHERYTAHRWWTADELATTTETVIRCGWPRSSPTWPPAGSPGSRSSYPGTTDPAAAAPVRRAAARTVARSG